MRTDPRKACANEVQQLGWALIHDGIAHPLMALSLYSKWSLRFHDWTSLKAWPRIEIKMTVFSDKPAPIGQFRIYAKASYLPIIEQLRDELREKGKACMVQAEPGEQYKLYILQTAK